ncbi:hypothetical protein L1887_40126 [Cichorium endivia]|nr:hypothetical protein L1887_40126 [Cichorium endivia]
MNSKKTAIMLHDESPSEVRVDFEEFNTDVTALFLAAHAGNVKLVGSTEDKNTFRLRVQLGVNMPAQANHKASHEIAGSTEFELFEVYDVVLYFGIIDILQEYNTRKKIEHTYKSIQHDPMSISVADPKFYSKRFLNFLEKVFPSNT